MVTFVGEVATQTSLTRTLLEALWEWGPNDFSAADVQAVRRLLLDHIAVAAFGSGVEAGRIMREHVLGDFPPGGAQAPIIGAESAPALAAAMANAVAAACYEFDDSHSGASLHPGAVIFPAALAATALSGCDEAVFLKAVLIGYEVMCRVGLAVNPQAHRARHFHPTATAGHFGAAAAAATCLGLDVEHALAALSLAGTAAGGSMQFLVEGGWMKQVHPAYAVERGVEAALLARRGFPGVRDPIAGERAFLAAQSEDPRPQLLLEGLGDRPREIRATGIKPYPSCRNTQTPLDALLRLRREHDLGPDNVTSITFGLVKPGMVTVWEPPERKRRPQNLVEAQFSMPYVAAVAITDGRVTPEQFRLERLSDPALVRLMDLVECVHDPELDRRYPESWPAWARVSDRQGRVYEAHAEHPRGDPSNPLSDAELMDKFDALAAGVYPAERRAAIQGAVNDLPTPGSLGKLLGLLATTTPTPRPAESGAVVR